MENPVLYIVLNGELGMSSGKAAAQATHAAMLLEGNYSGLFVAGYKRTVVVLEAKDGETIKNLLEYLQGAGIFAAYYIDENSEKNHPYQVTALAVEPINHDDEEKRSIFADFKLFGKPDYDDEYVGEVEPQTKSELNYIKMMLTQTRTEVLDIKRCLVVRPKWYQKIIKRKKNGIVS